MWRNLVGLMRFENGAASRPNPLKARPRVDNPALAEIAPTGPDPGNLRMFAYAPPGLRDGAPLVVVLHGCGQTAAGYDLGTGWSALAQRHGFALLAVEQKAVNNPGTCFNWFNPPDITRGEGEVASIAAMIGQMHALYGSGPTFITGLSAGGAMAAAMLAVYPDLFTGGAIIAGLPFGAAANVRDALEVMRSAPLRTPRQWGDLVRAASGHQGPWPAISIWHGAMDTTVTVGNAQALLAQWADLHGLSLAGAKQDLVDGAVRLRWGDRLESYTLPLLGHGTPIDSRDVGSAAPFILESGISSSSRILDFWGLASKPAVKPVPVQPQSRSVQSPPKPVVPEPLFIEPTPQAGNAARAEPDRFLRRVLRRLRGL